jgi:hypothetical protein
MSYKLGTNGKNSTGYSCQEFSPLIGLDLRVSFNKWFNKALKFGIVVK